MKTLQVQRTYSLLAVYVCLRAFACGQIPPESMCYFSIPDNETVYDKVAKWFDRDSKTIIVEYTIRVRNDNGSFNLYEQACPLSFQPWKWYRTQGVGSSHLLLTYDFYFGLLKEILSLGIEKINLNLEINPPGCLRGAKNQTVDNLLREFLLQDLDISYYSPKWAVARSDTVEICTARIDGSDGDGKLIYRCCSYNSRKQVICDDDSPDFWTQTLNIFIYVVSSMVLLFVLVKFGCRKHLEKKAKKKESNNYILEHEYKFLLYIQGSEQTQLKRVPLEGMSNFKSEIDRRAADIGLYVVSVTKTRVNVPRNELLGVFDEVDFLQMKLKEMLEVLDQRPICKRCITIIVIMIMYFSPSFAFFYVMLNEHSWYMELLDAYNKRGLKGPFYFQWSSYFETETCLVMILLGFHFSFMIACCLTYTCWHCFPGNECAKIIKSISLCFTIVLAIPSVGVLFIDVSFLISLLIMTTFTIIVQVRIWAPIVQGFVTLLIYLRVFCAEYWRVHVALKLKILTIFKSQSRFNKQRTVSTIAAETLELKLKSLNIVSIDSNHGKSSKNKEKFKLVRSNLQLHLNETFFFLNEYDVPSVTRRFFSKCLKFDCREVPKFKKVLIKSLAAIIFTPLFIALVIISVMAYGDIYQLSPSNSFFASFVTSLVPLVVKHFNQKDSPRNTNNYLERRFYVELKKGIDDFVDYLTVKDFTECTIEKASSDDVKTISLKLKYCPEDWFGDSSQQLKSLCHSSSSSYKPLYGSNENT